MARVNPNTESLRGAIAATGGTSVLTAAGGVAAQFPAGAGPVPVLLLYGISGVLALLTGLTKLYEIRCRRTPEYIAETSLARTARRHRDPDRSMRLALIGRALARNSRVSLTDVTALLTDPGPSGELPPPPHAQPRNRHRLPGRRKAAFTVRRTSPGRSGRRPDRGRGCRGATSPHGRPRTRRRTTGRRGPGGAGPGRGDE